MANRNFANSRLYTGHVMPVLLDCNFVVDSTNGNGLGIRSLKGPYVQNVFMHTTATPGIGTSNPATPAFQVTNPNPALGTIVVQLQDPYSRIYTGGNAIVSPIGASTKIDNTALTVGVAYTIIVVGDASLATWQSVGVPKGLTPAIGLSFIATSTGGSANVSSSRVAPTAANGSEVLAIETVGDTNQAIAPSITKQGFGAQIILQCRKSTTDHSAIVQPADGSVISLSFLLSNSSILINGE